MVLGPTGTSILVNATLFGPYKFLLTDRLGLKIPVHKIHCYNTIATIVLFISIIIIIIPELKHSQLALVQQKIMPYEKSLQFPIHWLA